MNFYTKQHQFYCGIDLHARSMYLCVLDQAGEVMLHRNFPAKPDAFLNAIWPFREDVVVAVECIFTWYWLADLCEAEGIPFVLGHALYMKAIHGRKAKNDKIDSRKIAGLLRSGMIPQAYLYPAEMRSTRDLLRRRMYLVRRRADLLAHIQNTNSQYNLPEFGHKIVTQSQRKGLEERFTDPCVRRSIEIDIEVADLLGKQIYSLEAFIVRTSSAHDRNAIRLLRTARGIGKILSLVILYEIQDIHRFASVQEFASYARLVKCSKESAGKRHGTSGSKIGNAHLKWAFSEAAVLFLRGNPEGLKYNDRLERKHGKSKALSILAHKLGRAVYYMLLRQKVFDMKKFLAC